MVEERFSREGGKKKEGKKGKKEKEKKIQGNGPHYA